MCKVLPVSSDKLATSRADRFIESDDPRLFVKAKTTDM